MSSTAVCTHQSDVCQVIKISYPVFLLAYVTFVNCSCKFPKQTVEILLL